MAMSTEHSSKAALRRGNGYVPIWVKIVKWDEKPQSQPPPPKLYHFFHSLGKVIVANEDLQLQLQLRKDGSLVYHTFCDKDQVLLTFTPIAEHLALDLSLFFTTKVSHG